MVKCIGMNAKIILILTLTAAIAVTVASVMIANHKTAPVAATVIETARAIPSVPKTAPPAEMPVPEIKPPIQSPPPAETQPVARPQKIPDQINQSAPPAGSKEPLQDPDARVALSLVGNDSGAEAYWVSAIFDTSLPQSEREDLMEDLNEDGLSNPKHPGPEDLPLIMNRIRIIEEIAPYADDFMLEHLGEAYKDLNHMLDGGRVQ